MRKVIVMNMHMKRDPSRFPTPMYCMLERGVYYGM